jgi:hypothetical protein
MRLALVLVLVAACTSKPETVTREQCGQVADHISSLIIEHYTAHPDELWDNIHAEPGDTGIPTSVTKETFKDWVATPEGKTWLLQRQGAVRTATEKGVEGCLKNATPKQVSCLLAATSREDVTACDTKK